MAPTLISKTLAVAACAIMFSAPSVHAQCVLQPRTLKIVSTTPFHSRPISWELEVAPVLGHHPANGCYFFGTSFGNVCHQAWRVDHVVTVCERTPTTENVSGLIGTDRRRFRMTVTWKSGETSLYTGLITDRGFIQDGQVTHSNNSGSTWKLSGTNLIFASLPPPPPPPPRTVNDGSWIPRIR